MCLIVSPAPLIVSSKPERFVSGPTVFLYEPAPGFLLCDVNFAVCDFSVWSLLLHSICLIPTLQFGPDLLDCDKFGRQMLSLFTMALARQRS